MNNVIEKLEAVVKAEYEAKYKEWLNISHEELIEKADEISAAQFVKDNIHDTFTEEEAEYLLQLITALNDPANIAVKEQFSDMVSEMYDKQDEYSDYELAEDEGMQMQ